MPVYAGTSIVGGTNCIRDNLKRYYDARDLNSAVNSTSWGDLSGNNSNSTGGIQPTWGGWYIDFDGTNDYAEFATLGFDEDDAFSMEMWIKFDAFANPRGGLMMCGAFGDSYGFYQNGGAVRFGIRPDSTLYKVEASSLSTGVWYFFSGTYDGGGDSGVITLYKNGVSQGTDVQEDTGLSTVEALRVGYKQILAGSSSGADNLNGQISVMRVYSKELSQDEVLYNFNADRGAFGI
jgi:hypothetical protein